MCQHVRGRRAGSSQRGDRETGVPLRVPECGPPQLRDDVLVVIVDLDSAFSARTTAVPPRWLDHGEHDDDDQRDNNDDEHIEKQQRRRGRGRGRGGQLVSQEESHPKKAREVGEPRRCPGGLHDRMADLRVLLRSINDGGKRHVRRSTVSVEEAGSPESLQPGSGGGRDAGSISCNGTPPCRLQNGLYPAARPQGGRQAVHCRQDAFLSWPFPSGVQVRRERMRFIVIPSDEDYRVTH